MLLGETNKYLNVDNITAIQYDKQNSLYTTEFVHTLKFHGIPKHSLELKVGY